MSVASPILAVTQTDVATAALFYLFAIMTGGAALCVVISRNIVRTAVCLLFALIGVTGIYFLLGAEFLAAVQLVVYVGGTLILIVFGVMLTSKSPFSRFEPKRGEVITTVVIGAVLLTSLVTAILRTSFGNSSVAAGGAYPVGPLGQALLGDYLAPFELASVILLVVMIGAAYLAKRRGGEAGMIVGLQHYLILGAALFVCGLASILLKRNAIGILMGVELILNGANVNLVAFNHFSYGGTESAPLLAGQVFAIFVIVVAAAEAAVAMAIFLNFYNNFSTIDVERAENLKG